MSNVDVTKPTVVQYRFFTIGQHEKEEQWLNGMAAKGLLLVRVFGIKYEFQQGIPGSYQYRLEFLTYTAKHPSSISYFSFLQKNEVEVIGFWGRWVYLRKQTTDGPFVLFSDLSSIYQHYHRIYQFSMILAIAEGIIFITRIMYLLQRPIDSNFVVTIFLGVLSVLFGQIAYKMKKRMKKIKRNQDVFDA